MERVLAHVQAGHRRLQTDPLLVQLHQRRVQGRQLVTPMHQDQLPAHDRNPDLGTGRFQRLGPAIDLQQGRQHVLALDDRLRPVRLVRPRQRQQVTQFHIVEVGHMHDMVSGNAVDLDPAVDRAVAHLQVLGQLRDRLDQRSDGSQIHLLRVFFHDYSKSLHPEHSGEDFSCQYFGVCRVTRRTRTSCSPNSVTKLLT